MDMLLSQNTLQWRYRQSHPTYPFLVDPFWPQMHCFFFHFAGVANDIEKWTSTPWFWEGQEVLEGIYHTINVYPSMMLLTSVLFFFPSQSFRQMIASCLVKDPSKRPTAKKLLKHPFFKKARSNDYVARTLLEGLPSLGDRMQELKVCCHSIIRFKIPSFLRSYMFPSKWQHSLSISMDTTTFS